MILQHRIPSRNFIHPFRMSSRPRVSVTGTTQYHYLLRLTPKSETHPYFQEPLFLALAGFSYVLDIVMGLAMVVLQGDVQLGLNDCWLFCFHS